MKEKKKSYLKPLVRWIEIKENYLSFDYCDKDEVAVITVQGSWWK